jgi:hypothetical protein
VGLPAASLALAYDVFGGYGFPPNPWICPQCAPELSVAELARTPLRSLSFAQLDAVHVMSLDDDALRHFFPRMMELLIATPAPVFDYRVSELKARLAGWSAAERDVVVALAEAVWTELIDRYPAQLGYFSDCPSALELLNWCELPLGPHLDVLLATEGQPAARHLADLVTNSLETGCSATILDWTGQPAVGARLQRAFFAASSDEVSRQLSAAHQLWAVLRG